MDAASIPRQLLNGVGWGIAAAGLLLAAAIALPLAFGAHPNTVLTGSMEPAISPGDVVITEQVSPLAAEVGDVVTFRDPEDQSRLITHRVVGIRRDGSHLWFRTQGDANNTTERWRIAAGGELGRVAYVVPWVGHAAVLGRTQLGLWLFLAIPLLLLAAEELWRIWRPRGAEGGWRVRRARTPVAALVVAALGSLALGTAALAAFSSQTQNEGNVVTAAPDFRAPVVGTVAIAKVAGGTPGFVKAGGEYFVYANVAADTGNPASGIASVKANVSTVTTGSTAVTLTAGSFGVGGVSYGYRSAALTASAVSAGAKEFTVTATDVAGNANSKEGTVTVDNTAPLASDIQTTNAGTVGLPEQNDTIVYTFSEPIEPESILAGWTGAATNVEVRVNDNGLLGLPAGNDSFEIWNSTDTAKLPLGTVDLGRSDYASGLLGGVYRFGFSGTPSKMTMSGNAITVVLGTYNSTIIVDAVRGTAAGTGTMVWTPVATPYDRAANAMATTTATESGAADKDF